MSDLPDFPARLRPKLDADFVVADPALLFVISCLQGYQFHEEIDLGQLDKQFRLPLPLSETKPPPPRSVFHTSHQHHKQLSDVSDIHILYGNADSALLASSLMLIKLVGNDVSVGHGIGPQIVKMRLKSMNLPCDADNSMRVYRKKKKKQDMGDMETGDDFGLEEELLDERGRERANMTIAQLEAQAEKEEERAKELEEWVQDFNLHRKGFDRNQNNMYRETFITSTKKIYESIDVNAKHQQQVLNLLGVFDSTRNAVRIESQKRVWLAKKLKIDELRRKTSRRVDMYQRLTSEGNLEKYKQNEQSMALEKETNAMFQDVVAKRPAKTPRQRQLEAVTEHRRRKLNAYEMAAMLGTMEPEVSKEVVGQYVQPCSSKRKGSAERTEIQGSVTGAPSAEQLTKERSKKRSMDELTRQKSQHFAHEETQDVLMTEDFEVDPDAPTPKDLLEVEENFRTKRR